MAEPQMMTSGGVHHACLDVITQWEERGAEGESFQTDMAASRVTSRFTLKEPFH